MKKVLSVLLAVCLFATLLVPAFAVSNGETIFGDYGDVTKVEFDKTEYALNDILNKDNNDLYVNVDALLTCWDKNGNRTNFLRNGESNTQIRAYWSSNQEVLALDQNTGKVLTIKNNRDTDVRITLRVTLGTGVQATTTIVVPANISSEASHDAYGYRLANTTVKKTNLLNGYVTGDTASFTVTAADAPKAATLLAIAPTYTVADGTVFTGAISADNNAVIIYTANVSGVHNVDAADAENFFKGLGGTPLNLNDPSKVAITAGAKENAVAVDANVMVECGTVAVAQALAAKGNVTVDTVVFNPVVAGTKVLYSAAAGTGTAFEFNAANKDAFAVALNAFGVAGANSFNAASLLNIVNGAAAVTAGTPTIEVTVTGTQGTDFATALGAGKLTIAGVEFTNNTSTATAIKLTAAAAADFADTAANKAAILAAINTIAVSGQIDNTAAVVVTSNGAAGTSASASPVVYNVVGDDAEITPILSTYAFTAAQKRNFKFAVRTSVGGNSGYTPVVAGAAPVQAYGLLFEVKNDADGVPTLYVGADLSPDSKYGTVFERYLNTYVYVRVTNDQFSNAQAEKEFSVKLVGPDGAAAKKVLPAEKQLGVGQTLDLRTLSKSVEDTKTYWTVDPYGNYQTAKEAGMIAKVIMETVDGDNHNYGWTVKGLAPGVVTIKLRDAYNGAVIDSMKLNIGAGAPATATPSTASATVKVNEQVKLSVKNLNSDEYVKWSIDNNNISLANYDGAAATVYGKKEGTAVVTAKVYESKAAANDGKDPVNTFKINVTVKAAESKPVTTPDTTAPTTNPQTGDSLFANLF